MFEMKRRGWQKTLSVLKTILADETKQPNTRVVAALNHIRQAMGETIKIPPNLPSGPLVESGDQPRRRSMRSQMRNGMAPAVRMVGPLGNRVMVSPESWEIIVKEMQAGRKIQAIKEIRTAMTINGAVPGLKECKDLIEGDIFLQNVYRPVK